MIDTFYDQIKVRAAGTDLSQVLWFRDGEPNEWESKIKRSTAKQAQNLKCG